MKTADPKARRRETLGNDSADDGHVDLLDPFGKEDRLAVRPAGRGRRGLADRLKQGPAAIGMEVRQGGGRAEGAGQPRPNAGADPPLVKGKEGSGEGEGGLGGGGGRERRARAATAERGRRSAARKGNGRKRSREGGPGRDRRRSS